MQTRNLSKRNDEALPAPTVSEEGSCSCAKSKRGKGYLVVKRPRNATYQTIGSAKRRKERDASHNVPEEEHELAELVHKVHLLCLLARGRIVDNACDDPLIQFCDNFRTRSQNVDKGLLLLYKLKKGLLKRLLPCPWPYFEHLIFQLGNYPTPFSKKIG